MSREKTGVMGDIGKTSAGCFINDPYILVNRMKRGATNTTKDRFETFNKPRAFNSCPQPHPAISIAIVRLIIDVITLLSKRL